LKRKPRVLLLSASSGAGHVRAAQALEKAFHAHGGCEVAHIDVLQYVSKSFQRIYDKTYISLVRRAPELMGFLYQKTDQPWHHPRRRLALDRLNTRPMIQLLKTIATRIIRGHPLSPRGDHRLAHRQTEIASSQCDCYY
jgi:processive 1,2-diacylglycerol beta-glucosyltransferase